MTPLDAVPQDWTGPDLPALRDILVQCYPQRTAAMDLSASAGLLVGTFPDRDNMRSTWRALIEELGNQGRLIALVRLAAEDPLVAAHRPRLLRLLAEGAPASERPAAERLIKHRSRILDIGLSDLMSTAAKSVGRLTLRFGDEIGQGTGFLIAKDQLLTSHHNIVDEIHGPVASVVVEFDHDLGVHEAPLARRAIPKAVVFDSRNDWALLRLERGVDRPGLRLGSVFDTGVDDVVVIIQHAKGAPKKFALETMAVRHVDDSVIEYTADTEKGSSGAPVFNQHMEVIAVHQGESSSRSHNQGVRIEPIISRLREEGIDFLTGSQESL